MSAPNVELLDYNWGYRKLAVANVKIAELEAKVAEQAATIATFESRVALLQKVFDQQATTIERLTGYKTAFDTAREQILYMVGPLEINEILTTMDEACEQAALEQAGSHND